MGKYTFFYLTMVTVGVSLASYLGIIDWTVFDKIVELINSVKVLG